MAKQEVALRKRQQIAKANRTMFLWVAGVSVLLGAAGVSSVFLVQKARFNDKIIAAKEQTAGVLEGNNAAIGLLEDEVRLLNTNQALLDSRSTSEEKPIQVILDALPADANVAALGASLQRKILVTEGVTLEGLAFDSISDSVSQTEGTGSVEGSSPSIAFTFSVTVKRGNADALRTLLRRLEGSIRAIDVKQLSIEMKGDEIEMAVGAVAFYEPTITAELKDITVKP